LHRACAAAATESSTQLSKTNFRSDTVQGGTTESLARNLVPRLRHLAPAEAFEQRAETISSTHNKIVRKGVSGNCQVSFE